MAHPALPAHAFPRYRPNINTTTHINTTHIDTRTIAGVPQLSYYAAVPPRHTTRVAILHGYGDHAGRYAHLQTWLAQRNIASYAVDFRGHGRSQGKPGFVRQWNENLNDLAAFLKLDALSTTTDPTPLFILAHSHGGLIAIVAGLQGMLDHCRGVILSAPYLDLKMPVPLLKRCFAAVMSGIHPSMQFRSGLNAPMLTRDPEMIAQSKADPFCRGIATPRWFFTTRQVQHQTRAQASQFKLPLLMLIPGSDTVANPAASIEFFEQCTSSDKTLKNYPDHRHELLRELGREEIFQIILDWIKLRSV